MTAAYPKMLYAAAGRGTVTVHTPDEEAARVAEGFVSTPSDAHRAPPRFHAPEIPPGVALTEAHLPLIADEVARAIGTPREPGAAALTEAHIPGIVDAVFERLRGMAAAAAGEPAAREAAEGVEALRLELDDRFDKLKADLLGEMRVLIAPAPAAKSGKA